MNEELQSWNLKVTDYLSDLNEKLKKNETASKLYNGFKIWYSEEVENPQILFIGINPGTGDTRFHKGGELHHTVDGKCQKFIYTEYLDNEHKSFKLAQQTISMFSKVGLNELQIRELFANSMKTNFFHIMTTNQNGINSCISSLGGVALPDYNQKSCEYTAELIRIIKPRFVICEGSNVFDRLNAGHFQQGQPLVNINKKDGVIYAETAQGTPILAYKRNRSNIANIGNVAEEIKERELITD